MPKGPAENLRPLEVAVKTYYWKPFAALFRALELRSYCLSRIACDGPILDLCCGDGKVALMLKELKVLTNSFCGLDYAQVELGKAKKTAFHKNLLQASANALPFKNGSFETIICNGGLESIRGGVDMPLGEVARVLSKNGVMIATVPIEKFTDILLFPRILKKISSKWCLRYITQLNRRLTHFNVYSSTEWHSLFKKNGLTVVESNPFFSSGAGAVWNILTLQIFRVSGFLKFIKNKKVIRVFSSFLIRAFQKIYIEEIDTRSEKGYVLIIAKKSCSYPN